MPARRDGTPAHQRGPNPTPLPSQIPETLEYHLVERVTDLRLKVERAAEVLKPGECLHCLNAYRILEPGAIPRRRKSD